MAVERLQKILSRLGIASRRKAEELILSKKVSVNGVVTSELGAKADLEKDQIEVGGKVLSPSSQKFHYYLYYKPRGIVVTKQDELGRRGIFDHLKLPPEVNSVGRLDKDSEGLLLLSDDGDFVHRYTHPKFGISKIYQVQISRKLQESEIKKLTKGILIEGQKLTALSVENFSWQEQAWIEIELGEGRKREIREMMDYLGVRIFRLIRVQHGEFHLGDLRIGELKEVYPKSIS